MATLEEEARELGQFNIELLGAYEQLEKLRAQGAPQQKIDEWLDDLAISTRGIQQTTARITALIQEERHQRWTELKRLDENIEEHPSVCGTIDNDVPCTLTPSWRSVSECCGWIDEACTSHRAKIDALLEHESIKCSVCGREVVLNWSRL